MVFQNQTKRSVANGRIHGRSWLQRFDRLIPNFPMIKEHSDAF
jgi:hypothetical protein